MSAYSWIRKLFPQHRTHARSGRASRQLKRTWSARKLTAEVLEDRCVPSVTVTPATGGTGISADNVASNTYTALGTITIAAGATGDFHQTPGTTVYLDAPGGWNFATSPAVTLSAQGNFTEAVITSQTASAIGIFLKVPASSSSTDVLAISGIQVIAQNGNTGASGPGDIYMGLGSYSINGITGGAAGTDFGDLSLVAGAPTQLSYISEPVTTTYGQAIPEVDVAVEDQFGNQCLADSTTQVSLAITPGTGTPGAVLNGGAAIPVQDGLAAYTDLTINIVGTGFTLDAAASGFSTATNPDPFAITPAPLTIYATSDGKVYDGTTASAKTPTTSTLYFGDTVTASQAFTSKNVLGTGASTLAVTNYTVNDGNGGADYTVTTATATGTITPAALTISATTDSKIYDGTTTSAKTPTTSTLYDGDTVTASQAFSSKNALGTGGSALVVTGYTVNDGDGGKDYTVTTATATGTITPAALTISATTDTKVYDGTVASSKAPTTSTLYDGDTVTASQAFSSKNVRARATARWW